MRVLIVDDSVVYRSQIKAALTQAAFIDELDTANNGKIAIEKLKQRAYDLVTLDLEMPEMDGVETLKQIKSLGFSTRVIMFSAQTRAGSEKTLLALSLGADDFVAKPSGEHLNINNAASVIKDLLLPKVRQFIVGSSAKEVAKSVAEVKNNSLVPEKLYTLSNERKPANYTKKDIQILNPKLIVIGSSTGGPPALEIVLKSLGPDIRCPILIAQHMPPVFTATLARRLEDISGTPCVEAKDMEVVQNKIYVAPGNFHMTLVGNEEQIKIKLDQRPERNHIRPAADFLFESAAKIYGPSLLGVVLTGMGEDACDGAMAIKANEGGVIIQSKESCVVFGMPGAVYQVKAFDEIMNLQDLNNYFKRKLTNLGVHSESSVGG